MKKSVIILGGGISGLAAAHYLQTQARDLVDFKVVESAPRFGGKIDSVQEDGFTVDYGPDSFISRKPAVVNLCRELGLENQLIGSNLINGKPGGVFVWSRGRLIAMPEGLMMMAPTAILPFLKSRLISWPGKIRMGLEALIPPRVSDEDESLASFVRRRLGQEALDKIAGPLFAGIYSGDPDTLSLRSTFSMFAEMERKHGGMVRSMMAQRAAAKAAVGKVPAGAPKGRSAFMSLRGGMGTLVDAVVAGLPAKTMLSGMRALSVTRHDHRFEIAFQNGQSFTADAVLMATPAYVAADLVEGFNPLLSKRLRAIHYVSTATVSLGFRRSDIPHPLNGTGFIVAQKENRKITACTWSSMKFANRAPEGFVLLRIFMGGARAPGLAELPAEEQIRIAREELRITMGIDAEPVLAKTYRFLQGSPQYEVGHAARVNEIAMMAGMNPGLQLAGSAYRGAGLPECIESGIEGAKKILQSLAQEESEPSLCAEGVGAI